MDRVSSNSAANSWPKIKLPIRIIASGAFVFWLGVIVIGGFSWPLGHRELSLWPWNQSWFMFYYSTDKHYLMQAKGTLVDGSEAPPLVERYFKYQAAFHSTRFNEVTRDVHHARRLAAYLCRQYNREVQGSARLETISIWDTWWPNKRGVRRYEHEVPATEKRSKTYVDNESCAKLEAEVLQ